MATGPRGGREQRRTRRVWRPAVCPAGLAPCREQPGGTVLCAPEEVMGAELEAHGACRVAGGAAGI